MPRVYLQGFADDKNQMLCRRKGQANTFRISISDASVRKDFYSLPGHPNSPDEFEKTLGRFEQYYPKWLSLIEQSKPITNGDRLNLAGYLAFQVLRGVRFYDAVSVSEKENVLMLFASLSSKDLQAWFRSQDYALTTEEVETIRLEVLSGYREVEVGSRAFVQHVDREVQAIQGHLVARKWQFLRYDEHTLITSDQPISLLTGSNSRSTEIYETLMELNIEISMPLSRNIGLKIMPPSSEDLIEIGMGIHDVFRQGTVEEADVLNQTVSRQAEEAIFAHPDDSALLASLDIP